MALEGEVRHLTPEEIQEFLDHGLPPREEAVAQEHLSVCPQCRSEAESWSLLFSELESLPEMKPRPAFSNAVMAKVTLPRPLGSRLKGWLGRGAFGDGSTTQHLPQERMQDLVEGLLPVRSAALAKAHLESCVACREEISWWERLFGALGALGRFAPSQGFAERVMARVRIPAPAPVRWGAGVSGRALAWARSAFPGTRRGWAIAGGVASAPTITMAALVYLVFSNSILTVGSLATYSYWKATDLVFSVLTLVKNGFLESVALFRAYAFFETAASSPFLLGAGGLAFSLLTAGALWVLYRNLIVAPSDDRYARART